MQEVHLTCSGDREALFATVDALKAQLAVQPEEVEVIDWGWSAKLQQGYIVLAWTDEVDPAFEKQLLADEAILDFCVYTVPVMTDAQLALLEAC